MDTTLYRPLWRLGLTLGALLLCGSPGGCGDSPGGDDNTNANLNTAPDPVCGNGEVEAGEECDDGAANSDNEPDACRSSCRSPWCGDGVQDSSEGCDDGVYNSDTAPNACRTSCAPAGCGDGVVDPDADPPEACDDGDGNSDTTPNACRSDCSLPVCEDGVLDHGQACYTFGALIDADGIGVPGRLDADALADFAVAREAVLSIQVQDATLSFTELPGALWTGWHLPRIGDFDGDGDGDVLAGSLLLENTAAPGAAPTFRAPYAYAIEDCEVDECLPDAFLVITDELTGERYLLTIPEQNPDLVALDSAGRPTDDVTYLQEWPSYGYPIARVFAVPDLTGEGLPEAVICYEVGQFDQESCQLLRIYEDDGYLDATTHDIWSFDSAALLPTPSAPAGLVGCSFWGNTLEYVRWNGVTFESLGSLVGLPPACSRVYTLPGAGPFPEVLTYFQGAFMLHAWNGSTYVATATVNLGTATPGRQISAELGDLNGDGLTDFVYSYANWLPDEGGVVAALQWGGMFDLHPLRSSPGGVYSPQLGDIDGDGNDDVLVAPNRMGWDALHLGAEIYFGSASMDSSALVHLPGAATWIHVADVDGDGDPDLLANDNAGAVVGVVVNDGGALRTARRIGSPAAGVTYYYEPQATRVADLTGDGIDDAVLLEDEWLLVASLPVDGRFTRFRETELTQGLTELHAADLDGDGLADLVGHADAAWHDGDEVRYPPEAAFHILYNDPSDPGSFPDSSTHETAHEVYGLAVGDLNGDGLVDVVASHGVAGIISVYLNEGTADEPAFCEPGDCPDYLTAGTISDLQLVDLDGDGALDVLVATPYEGNGPVLFWGLGDGSLSPLIDLPYLGGEFVLHPVDLDGDGALDLAATRYLLAQDAFLTMVLHNVP